MESGRKGRRGGRVKREIGWRRGRGGRGARRRGCRAFLHWDPMCTECTLNEHWEVSRPMCIQSTLDPFPLNPLPEVV